VEAYSNDRVVIRSSSTVEDSWQASFAGGFESVLNVEVKDSLAVADAIQSVLASYGDSCSPVDQILVQRHIGNIHTAGVALTCDLHTGAPYYIFNLADTSGSTTTVTSGETNLVRTIVVSRYCKESVLSKRFPQIIKVFRAIKEIERTLSYDKLDIEFAIDFDETIHIFQVRPITVDHSEYEVDTDKFHRLLRSASVEFEELQFGTVSVVGDQTYFASMPDWNPAEIIGIYPNPLAFSLYRYLITDEIWAQQRAEYGYRDVRPQPLIQSFLGQPYVDVRSSFSSFVPASLGDDVAAKLVNAHLAMLREAPELHDKVEFDILFTVWVPDIESLQRERFEGFDLKDSELEELRRSLVKIARDAITRLADDISSIDKLELERQRIQHDSTRTINKICSALYACKRYGTLAFAHAARAGFVASAMLRSLERLGVLSAQRRVAFDASFITITGELERDQWLYTQGDIPADTLIRKYGHLRPGTYDISSEAYWTNPQKYIFPTATCPPHKTVPFNLSDAETSYVQTLIDALGVGCSPDQLFFFFQEAIKARESVKFEFTKTLSYSLDQIALWWRETGLEQHLVEYVEHADLLAIRNGALNLDELQFRLHSRVENYKLTRCIQLPSIIFSEQDFFCFELMAHQPNFVTRSAITADVIDLENTSASDLVGKIVLVQQADPGFDWIFSRDIAGLITMYGGANSHMTIRAAEMSIPAAIGIGDLNYRKLIGCSSISLDCQNRTIRRIR
jgi:hypothetical protein